jgi:hypothetical protein
LPATILLRGAVIFPVGPAATVLLVLTTALVSATIFAIVGPTVVLSAIAAGRASAPVRTCITKVAAAVVHGAVITISGSFSVLSPLVFVIIVLSAHSRATLIIRSAVLVSSMSFWALVSALICTLSLIVAFVTWSVAHGVAV